LPSKEEELALELKETKKRYIAKDENKREKPTLTQKNQSGEGRALDFQTGGQKKRGASKKRKESRGFLARRRGSLLKKTRKKSGGLIEQGLGGRVGKGEKAVTLKGQAELGLGFSKKGSGGNELKRMRKGGGDSGRN